MAQAEVTDDIELSDFTPGIYSDFRSGGGTQSAPDGAAQVADTWGCYAAPGGGLVPMPLNSTVFDVQLSGTFTGDNRMPSNRRYLAVLDTLNYPGIRPPYQIETTLGTPDAAPTLADYSGRSDLFSFVLQRYYDSGNAGSFKRQWAAYIWGIHIVNSSAVDVINWAGGLAPLNSSSYDFGFGALAIGRANGTDPLLPGQPHFKIAIGGRVNIAAETLSGVYISPGDAVYAPVVTVANVGSPLLIAHQGRTVWSDVSTFEGDLPVGTDAIRGANYMMDSTLDAAVNINETLYWTAVNSLTQENTTGTVFVEENPTGYGTWASMNANELFLVKNSGGGVLVRGSLNNPTVVRLPGVESTLGVVSSSVVTPLGCVYGSRSGVWVWNGSDTAQCLSPNLDGYFWENPDTSEYHPMQSVGRFGYHHPFIFAPGNWIYDVRTGGWFRLSDPDDVMYSFYSHSIQGRVYAVPAILPIPSPAVNPLIPFLHGFVMDSFCIRWSWKSQPLNRTKNRRIDVREINVTAQGVGTIIVTLTGLDGATVSKTFTIDSANQPISMTQPVKMSSHDVVVKMVADGSSGPDDEAPRLYRLTLGIREAQGITATGSEV